MSPPVGSQPATATATTPAISASASALTSSSPSPDISATATTGHHLHHNHHNHHPEVHSLHPISLPAKLSDDFIHAFSGAAAGFASGIFTCPLDVIKTKLQAQGGFERPDSQNVGRGVPRGFRSTAQMIWSEEGIRGMYRGLGPIIMGYLPTWAVYFTVYEKSKKVLGRTERIRKPWLTHILSAMIAGASSTICTNPIWVVKTRLMAQASHNSTITTGQPPWHYTGTLDAVKKMYSHEGIRAFYSGLGPGLLGLTHVAVQFPLYEKFKKIFVREKIGPDGKKKVDLLGILLASCLSKICASSATYPHEVMRTRLQTQYRPNGSGGGKEGGQHRRRYIGLIQTFKTIYKDEGWRAFYSGMGTNMIRAVPASAMTLLTYELCSTYLLKWKERSKPSSALQESDW